MARYEARRHFISWPTSEPEPEKRTRASAGDISANEDLLAKVLLSLRLHKASWSSTLIWHPAPDILSRHSLEGWRGALCVRLKLYLRMRSPIVPLNSGHTCSYSGSLRRTCRTKWAPGTRNQQRINGEDFKQFADVPVTAPAR